MTYTSRDLLEAEAFHRRRILTAFLSGAPGGREVEPRREGRTIVSAVALGLLLVGATVVSHVVTGHATADPSHAAGVPTPVRSRPGPRQPTGLDPTVGVLRLRQAGPYREHCARMISRIGVPRSTLYTVAGKSNGSCTAHSSSWRSGENSWAGSLAAIQPIGTTEPGGR